MPKLSLAHFLPPGVAIFFVINVFLSWLIHRINTTYTVYVEIFVDKIFSWALQTTKLKTHENLCATIELENVLS